MERSFIFKKILLYAYRRCRVKDDPMRDAILAADVHPHSEAQVSHDRVNWIRTRVQRTETRFCALSRF